MNILDQVRNFLTAPSLDEALGALAHNPAQPPIRTSWVWDSHITESSAGGGGKGKLPQTVSLSWDENEARGIEASARSWQGLTRRERKEILLAIYLANPWVSACVNVIASRICSGGFTVEKIDEESKDNQQHYDQLYELCLRVNDDWDFLQYARASLVDKLIFGETYTEIVWKAGLPYQLFKVDCITMDYRASRSGQIIEFRQQLTSTSEVNKLKPEDIIRWWTPHPRSSIDPFAPIERVQDAVNLDKKMTNWLTTFFQKGAKWPNYTRFPGEKDEAERYLEWVRQNYTGEKNAHLPPVTWGGAEIIPLGSGSMDIDFDKGLNRTQILVLTAYHVPPAAVSLIESGNIGGGTGEDQDKSLQYNACDPVKHDFLEKLNYRIVQQGFKIHDYRIGLRYADYRNDESLAKVQDTRIRNGSITINEARAESGKKPYKSAGDTGIVVASKDVFPVPRLDEIGDEQQQSAELDIEAKQTANEKAKNPPDPVVQPGQQPPNNQPGKPVQGNVTKPANTANQKQQASGKKQQKQESADDQEQSDRDKLAYALAAIFLALHSGQFSTDEHNRMVTILAEAYLASRMTAYLTAMQAIGGDATWEPAEADMQEAKGWAAEQVGSITSTFESMFQGAMEIYPLDAVADKAKQWIEHYASWKPQQIANVTLGSGADAGTRAAVDDMLEALTSDEIDTSMIPDGVSADQIKARVLPSESSNDLCAEYAGKTFDLSEVDSIPGFPIHPECPHYVEVYVVGGPDDGMD